MRTSVIVRVLAATAVAAMVLTQAGCAKPGANQAASTPQQATATSSSSAKVSSFVSASATPSPSKTVENAVLLQKGQVAPLTREVQARLRQLNLFDYYDVTDTYGPVTADAVSKFQTANGLTANGEVNTLTMDKLKTLTKIPSQAELTNTNPGPAIMGTGSNARTLKQLQLRLKQLEFYTGAPTSVFDPGTTAAVTGFQTSRKMAVTGVVDQRTWDYLCGETHDPTPWEIDGVAPPMQAGDMPLSADCIAISKTKGTICVSLSARKVAWVADGAIVMSLDTRTGSKEHPTNPGIFTVYYKDKDLVSRIWGSDIPMPWSTCFDNGRCVHFSHEFTKYGWSEGGSHGCVNTRDMEGTKWIFEQSVVGHTQVVVYN